MNDKRILFKIEHFTNINNKTIIFKMAEAEETN